MLFNFLFPLFYKELLVLGILHCIILPGTVPVPEWTVTKMDSVHALVLYTLPSHWYALGSKFTLLIYNKFQITASMTNLSLYRITMQTYTFFILI